MFSNSTSNNNSEIYFYHKNQPNDIYPNVNDIGFKFHLNGKVLHVRSAENLFQGVRWLTVNRVKDGLELIADNRDPGAWLQKAVDQKTKDHVNENFYDKIIDNLVEYYQSCPGLIPKDFEYLSQIRVKEQLMLEILAAKFTQNRTILKALLETGTARLIENTLGNSPDSFWGNAIDPKTNQPGRNGLGIALMRLRFELNKELNEKRAIYVREGFSEELCRRLNLPFDQSQYNNPEYVDQITLDNTIACTTVQAYQLEKAKAQGLQQQTTQVNVQQSAVVQSMFAALAPYKLQEIKHGENPHKESVIKLRFASGDEARQFGLAVSANSISKEWVIIGFNTTQTVADNFQLSPTLFSDLTSEIRKHSSLFAPQPAATVQTNDNNSVNNNNHVTTVSNHNQAVLDAPQDIQTDVNKTYNSVESVKFYLKERNINVHNLTVGPDFKIAGAKVVKLYFSTAAEANAFKETFNLKSVNNNIVIMSETTTNNLLAYLGFGYFLGKPIFQALVEDFENFYAAKAPTFAEEPAIVANSDTLIIPTIVNNSANSINNISNSVEAAKQLLIQNHYNVSNLSVGPDLNDSNKKVVKLFFPDNAQAQAFKDSFRLNVISNNCVIMGEINTNNLFTFLGLASHSDRPIFNALAEDFATYYAASAPVEDEPEIPVTTPVALKATDSLTEESFLDILLDRPKPIDKVFTVNLNLLTPDQIAEQANAIRKSLKAFLKDEFKAKDLNLIGSNQSNYGVKITFTTEHDAAQFVATYNNGVRTKENVVLTESEAKGFIEHWQMDGNLLDYLFKDYENKKSQGMFGKGWSKQEPKVEDKPEQKCKIQ